MLSNVARRVGYSVRKMRSGRWQVLARDPASGEQIGMGTYADKREAEKAGQRHAASMSAGTWLDPRRGEVELREYVSRWLESRARTGQHGDRYSKEATRLARDYLLPQLGSRVLVDITTPVVRQWHAEVVAQRIEASRRELAAAEAALAALRKAKAAPVSIAGAERRVGRAKASAGKPGLQPAKAYRLLHAVLADAVRDELIARNPCVERGAGVERSQERPLLEPEQIAVIAETIRPWWRATVLVGAWCSLRFGELAELRRRDVDLLHGTIAVTKAKTPAGVRTVTMPKQLAPVLEEHLARWSQPGPDGLVFVGPKGGPMVRSNFTTDFRRACDVLGLTAVTFHDLRHAGGTMAAQAGATERELQARLGHASPNAARRYQHAAQRRDRDLADRLGVMLGEVPTTSDNAQPTRKVRKLRADT